MIFVAEIQQCTSTASLDRLNLGTIPYGTLHKGSRKAAKASPKTTPGGGGHRDGIQHPPVHNKKSCGKWRRTDWLSTRWHRSPPPLLLCRAVQRWAPSTVPACLDPAADLDRPASNSETATCLSDGGLQPTSRKTLISFSPRLTRQNRGIRMAFGLRIIKIRPSLENERLEFHAACITRQGVAVRMQQVQVGPVVPFLGAVDYGSPSHRHLARILADQRVGGNGTH